MNRYVLKKPGVVFRVDDRVEVRVGNDPMKSGTVVGFCTMPTAVRVLLDGRKSSAAYHVDFLSLIESPTPPTEDKP